MTYRFTVAGHQPDLLPYTGWFYKLARADLMDLKIWDQYVNRGYQRRVQMREKWAGLKLTDEGGSYASIYDKRIDPDQAPKDLSKCVYDRYAGSRHWRLRNSEILALIEGVRTDKLWQFNFELLLGIRDWLGIDTPISIAKPTQGGGGSVGLVSVLQRYPITHYLSGTGARAYMENSMDVFSDAGIVVEWSRHKHISGDSILTTIFDHEDPLSVVLAEHEEEN
jgi:hypothetical protein